MDGRQSSTVSEAYSKHEKRRRLRILDFVPTSRRLPFVSLATHDTGRLGCVSDRSAGKRVYSRQYIDTVGRTRCLHWNQNDYKRFRLPAAGGSTFDPAWKNPREATTPGCATRRKARRAGRGMGKGRGGEPWSGITSAGRNGTRGGSAPADNR